MKIFKYLCPRDVVIIKDTNKLGVVAKEIADKLYSVQEDFGSFKLYNRSELIRLGEL